MTPDQIQKLIDAIFVKLSTICAKYPFLQTVLAEAQKVADADLPAFIAGLTNGLSPQQIVDEFFAYLESKLSRVVEVWALKALNAVVDGLLSQILADIGF